MIHNFQVRWKTQSFSNAPIGAGAFLVLCFTGLFFPLVDSANKWLALLLIVICGVSFTPAITCSVFSVFRERSKVFALFGLAVAALTIVLEPKAIELLKLGLGLVPVTVVVLTVQAKRRASNRVE